MKRKLYRFIVIGTLLLLTLMTSCKNDYANEMFEIYQTKDFERIILRDADIIPLGQYKKCDVACFHEKHEENIFLPDILTNCYVGAYCFGIPCKMTWIVAYNRKMKELVHISDAYDLGWISNDDLLHIIYEFDRASEQFSYHDWQKSESFVWDLEYYRKDK